MDFSELALYKVIEAQRVVCVVPANGIMPGPHTALIQGPIESVIYYLPRYLAARAAGMDERTAHATAMQGAKINDGVAVLVRAPGS